MSQTPATGRRDQKLLATRERLDKAAQRLFLERGFSRTTVEEIAAAAGVSRRTFFNYFDSKEDVLFSHYASFERALTEAIRSVPPGRTALDLAEHAVSAVLDEVDPEDARALEQIKKDVPALQERDRGKYEWLEQTVTAALAERTGEEREGLRLRLDAMVITTVLRVALDGWVAAATAGVSTRDHVGRIVRALEASLERG